MPWDEKMERMSVWAEKMELMSVRNPGCAKCRRYRVKGSETGNLDQCTRNTKRVETGYDPQGGTV